MHCQNTATFGLRLFWVRLVAEAGREAEDGRRIQHKPVTHFEKRGLLFGGVFTVIWWSFVDSNSGEIGPEISVAAAAKDVHVY